MIQNPADDADIPVLPLRATLLLSMAALSAAGLLAYFEPEMLFILGVAWIFLGSAGRVHELAHRQKPPGAPPASRMEDVRAVLTYPVRRWLGTAGPFGHASIQWDAYLDGQKIGSVPGAVRARIDQRIKHTGELYVMQAASFALLSARIAAAYVLSVPLIVATAVLVAFAGDPHYMLQLAAQIPADAALATQTGSLLGDVLVRLALWYAVIGLAAGAAAQRFGFVNHVGAARTRALCAWLREQGNAAAAAGLCDRIEFRRVRCAAEVSQDAVRGC